MIRLNELKKRKYLPQYDELYKLLYGLDIDYLLDCSEMTTKGDFLLDIRMRSKDMKEEVRVTNSYRDYVIIIQSTKPDYFDTYRYEKIQYYTFDSLVNLITKLKELLLVCLGEHIISPLGSPYEKIYDIISYAKIGLIADDSTWRKKEGSQELRLLLVSEQLNKMIWVEHHHYCGERWTIKYNELDKESEGVPFNQYIITSEFENAEELYIHLKEMLKPCLKKKRLRNINHKYNTSFKELYCN